MSEASQPSIRDYALLSDSQGAALVSRAGSIDWACMPRFDSPSSFARILGHDAGHWSLSPTETTPAVERSYVDATMVLSTVFRTERGVVKVTDAMPFIPTGRGHGIGHQAPHALIRLVEGLDGDVEMVSEVAPRPEYGLTIPRWTPTNGGATCRGGPTAYVLSCPASVEFDGGTARARFTVRKGERVGLALRAGDPFEPAASTWSTEQVRTWLYGTVSGWQSWSALHQNYQGPYADLVHHSGRVLQALTHAPTGAIIAAPTTSLPEEIGGSRNWDYRYAWVRDASLTLRALWIAACPDEAVHFFDFFATAAGGRAEGDTTVDVLYGIGGERHLPEVELSHLPGHRGSVPVRIGNSAWKQSQLDVYGEILDAAGLYVDNGFELDENTAQFLVELADQAAARWHESDHGIWEFRGEPRHFLHSKLMCWVALDRACHMASDLGASDESERWAHERDRIRDAILEQGWSDAAQAFTQTFDGDDLDASALMIPIVGFLPGTDPRVRSTIDAIATHLSDEHGLVYRYRGSDGLDGGEASFGICTYWLVHALALAGDIEAARERFDAVTAFANDVHLLSEEIDGATGELLGNFPQAFTHIGLINAANAIAEAERAVA
ncbi:glycoside hydrolase family 15 protein [soil metagenome]